MVPEKQILVNSLISNISTTSTLLQLNALFLLKFLFELINQKKKQLLVFTSILSNNKRKRLQRLQKAKQSKNVNEVVGSDQEGLTCGGKI